MLPESLEKPNVTEIQVRIDCNGCVQKIKKALHGINGIYDVYIDIPKQKLTIIGWADPEKIVKAIQKIRKTATICSDTTQTDSESTGGDVAPSSDPANPPVEEGSPEEQNPPTEPPPIPDVAAAQSTGSIGNQPPESPRSKGVEVEEVHVVYHYPPYHQNNVHADSGRQDHYPGSHRGPPHPIQVTHSYSRYKPTPYVTEYEHMSPQMQHNTYSTPEPPPRYTSYSWPEAPQPYTYYSRPEPQVSLSRPEPQVSLSRPMPPPQKYSRLEQSQPYSRPEPPPQQYSRPVPPHYYGQPEAPPQYIHYSRPEPPQQYSHYAHPEPRQEYIRHSRVEPSPLHTYYSRLEPPAYMHYDDDYNDSNRNGDTTSAFSNEDPDGCRIV